LSEIGQPVALGEIDRALRDLWDSNEAATKASLVNFAIYSEAADALHRNSDVIAGITREHACRAILVAARPGGDRGPPRVKSWITAHCHLGDGGRKSVCSEQVAFEIEGATADVIRNIVFAHLDSDLPLVFWWQGDFSAIFEERLYSLIDRLVIDSASWSDPARQARKLRSARSARACRWVLYDLNWARLRNLRLATAGLFDDSAALAALPSVERLTVTHGPGGRFSALLFVAWVHSRLGRPLPFALATRCESGYHICKIEFSSPGGTLAVGNSERQANLLKATIDLPGHHAEHLHPAAPAAVPDLVNQQLAHGGVNSSYFRLLSAATRLLAGLPAGS
jgi:glucose-6-phosphate dehydrogenase assembly protein OpcA